MRKVRIAVAGGYFGAQLGRVAPAHVVRVATLSLSTLITIAFFVKAYAPSLLAGR